MHAVFVSSDMPDSTLLALSPSPPPFLSFKTCKSCAIADAGDFLIESLHAHFPTQLVVATISALPAQISRLSQNSYGNRGWW